MKIKHTLHQSPSVPAVRAIRKSNLKNECPLNKKNVEHEKQMLIKRLSNLLTNRITTRGHMERRAQQKTNKTGGYAEVESVRWLSLF